MTIQIPNPGTGNGATGDNEFVLWSKVKDNFNDQTNAASRLVGTSKGQIPLVEQTFKTSASTESDRSVYDTDIVGDCNSFEVGTKFAVNNKVSNTPPSNGVGGTFGDTYSVETRRTLTSNKFQIAYSYASNETKVYARSQFNNAWAPWVLLTQSSATYSTTTAIAPNVVVETDGTLKRSSSSAKYKNVIAKLEMDDVLYQKAMQVKPIIYRSKADGDPKDWHYISFLAEEIGGIDPSLTQWRTHETVYNEETGESEQVPLEQKEAEGINLNAICAVLHATNIKQAELIDDLKARVEALEGGA